MEYLRSIVRQNLKDLRASKGLTASKLSQMAGISQSAYSRYESNGWVPDPEEIAKLAHFYNVPPSRIFYDPSLSNPSVIPPAKKDEIIADLLTIIEKLS